MFYNINGILGILSVLYISKTTSMKLDCNYIMEEVNSLYSPILWKYININTEGVPLEELITFYGLSSGQNEFTVINKTNIDTVFNLNYNIAFLIHAFTESFNGSLRNPNDIWMQDVARAWTSQYNINVICVDWFSLAYKDYFVTATQNTKIVGNYIASFIQDISDANGIPINSFTLVGHSLGGQVVGFIGANLKGKIGSIIALDPAGPCFTNPVDEGTDNRLDPTDAMFVQVLHTACGSLGTQISCGHVDFYANGGAMQPGCVPSFASLIDSDAIHCSHLRSTHIFNSSLYQNNVFVGHQCSQWPVKCNAILSLGSIIPLIDTIFQPIYHCDGTSDAFGINATSTPGAYEFQTSASYPFCES